MLGMQMQIQDKQLALVSREFLYVSHEGCHRSEAHWSVSSGLSRITVLSQQSESQARGPVRMPGLRNCRSLAEQRLNGTQEVWGLLRLSW